MLFTDSEMKWKVMGEAQGWKSGRNLYITLFFNLYFVSFYHTNKLCLTVFNDLVQFVLFLAISVYCDNILKQKLSYEFTLQYYLLGSVVC